VLALYELGTSHTDGLMMPPTAALMNTVCFSQQLSMCAAPILHLLWFPSPQHARGWPSPKRGLSAGLNMHCRHVSDCTMCGTSLRQVHD
jgi:hypothetical protein